MATGVSRAEFELLRDELRDTKESLRSLEVRHAQLVTKDDLAKTEAHIGGMENKLWMIVAAVALGAVNSVLGGHGAPHIATGTASLAGAVVTDIGRALLAFMGR